MYEERVECHGGSEMESIVLFINRSSKRLNEEWRVLYEGQPRTWKQPVSSHPLPVKHKKRAAMRPQHDLKVRTPGSYTKYACPPACGKPGQAQLSGEFTSERCFLSSARPEPRPISVFKNLETATRILQALCRCKSRGPKT